MATAIQPLPTLLALHDYLHTTCHPDREFVDGQVEERNLGETPHNLLQVELAYWSRLRRAEWKVRALTEQRTRVSPARVRIPDVSIVPDDDTIREKIRSTPPLIAIEILSPEDRMDRVISRLADLLNMGVEGVWLFDSAERVAYTYTAKGLAAVDTARIALANSPLCVDLAEIFSAVD